MRARYIIRDMANGSPKAWRQAEWKLRKGQSHESVEKDLRDALATLRDPRKKIEQTPADGHRYAVTVHAAPDWGDYPAVVDTGWDFDSRAEAEVFAMQEMWRQYCLGTRRDQIGAYVTSNDAEQTDDENPSVFELLTLPPI